MTSYLLIDYICTAGTVHYALCIAIPNRRTLWLSSFVSSAKKKHTHTQNTKPIINNYSYYRKSASTSILSECNSTFRSYKRRILLRTCFDMVKLRAVHLCTTPYTHCTHVLTRSSQTITNQFVKSVRSTNSQL